MSNYVLTLSDKVDCTNDMLIAFLCMAIGMLFILLITFIGEALNGEEARPAIIIGIIFLCFAIPTFIYHTFIYHNAHQVQTYTISNSILHDNEAKTELLKDYSIIEKSDGVDGQIYLIKTKDAKYWR